MARLIQRFRESPHACPYLPDQTASMDVRVMLDVTPAELGALLARGWRRFGASYFRPACSACSQCVSTRILAREFVPTRSQRRARRLASKLTRVVSAPVVDIERLGLYERWHAQREVRRGWAENPLDEERYAFDFAFAHPSVREVAFRDPASHDRLVGLGIVDVVPNALSAVYFFWDPEHAPPSLGVAHIVWLIEDAARLGHEHVYLGYRVDACVSMAYKGRYLPQESLDGRPRLDDSPVWRRSAVTGGPTR
jgi:leucyl-tRNA---protein transferase